MAQGPVFKDYQKQHAKNRPESVEFAGGLPRRIPTQRLHMGTSLVKSNPYAKPAYVPQREGMADAMALVPKVDTKQHLIEKPTRHKPNPFLQEKVIRHPVYPAAAVDLNGPQPRPRKQPVESVYRQDMIEARKAQQMAPTPTPPQPGGYQRSKYADIYVPTKLPRMKPFSQDEALRAHMNIERHDTRDKSGLTWRHPSFKAQPSMYQRVAEHRDYRLEKRKEQQEAYQDRRHREKQRMDALYSKIAQAKHGSQLNP